MKKTITEAKICHCRNAVWKRRGKMEKGSCVALCGRCEGVKPAEAYNLLHGIVSKINPLKVLRLAKG